MLKCKLWVWSYQKPLRLVKKYQMRNNKEISLRRESIETYRKYSTTLPWWTEFLYSHTHESL